jgi:hypothetical protein
VASNTKNVKLGVCKIFFDNQDMGYTQGGVEVTVSTETHKVEIDQFGKTPINEFIQGRSCSVKAPLAETTLRILVATMPGASLVTDGVQASATATLGSNPIATDAVTIGGQAFTFQAGNPTTVYQVKIGATIAESAANLAKAINLSGIQAALGGVFATVNEAGTIVTVKASDPGTAPNAITFTKTGTSITVSGATLLGGVAETKARVDVLTGVGTDMLAIAKELRLHPINKAATDFSEDFVVHKTASAGALQFAYKFDAERVYNVEFQAYPDPVTQKLFSVGDPLA